MVDKQDQEPEEREPGAGSFSAGEEPPDPWGAVPEQDQQPADGQYDEEPVELTPRQDDAVQAPVEWAPDQGEVAAAPEEKAFDQDTDGEPRTARRRRLPPTMHEIRPKTGSQKSKRETTLSFRPPTTAIPTSALTEVEFEPADITDDLAFVETRRFPYALLILGLVAVTAIIIVVQFVGIRTVKVITPDVGLEKEVAVLKVDLSDALKNKEEMASHLNGEINKLRTALSTARSERENLDGRLALAEDEKRRALTELATVSQDVEDALAEAERYFAALKKANDNLGAERSKIAGMIKELEDMKKTLDEKEALIAKLKKYAPEDTDPDPIKVIPGKEYLATIEKWARAYNSLDVVGLISCYSKQNKHRKEYESSPKAKEVFTKKLREIMAKNKLDISTEDGEIKGYKAYVPIKVTFKNAKDPKATNATMTLIIEDGEWLILEEGF